jgi:hypothetical protein
MMQKHGERDERRVTGGTRGDLRSGRGRGQETRAQQRVAIRWGVNTSDSLSRWGEGWGEGTQALAEAKRPLTPALSPKGEGARSACLPTFYR